MRSRCCPAPPDRNRPRPAPRIKDSSTRRAKIAAISVGSFVHDGPYSGSHASPHPGSFPGDERGATAIEYGLIAALIGVACVMAFMKLGLNLGDIFNKVRDALP